MSTSPSTMSTFATGTRVRRFDLTTANIEDIVVGDKLLGPDGKSRTVRSVARGRGSLYFVYFGLQGSTLQCDHLLASGTLLLLPKTAGATRRRPHNLEDLAKDPELLTNWRATRPVTLSFAARTPDSLKPPNFSKTIDPYILGLHLAQQKQKQNSISSLLSANCGLISPLWKLAGAPSIALGDDSRGATHPDDATPSSPADFQSLHVNVVEDCPWEPLARALFGSDSTETMDAVDAVLSRLGSPPRIPSDVLGNAPNVQGRVLGAMIDSLGTVDVETGRVRIYFEPVWPEGLKDDVKVLARCLGFGVQYYEYGRNGFWDDEEKISFIQLHGDLTTLPCILARLAKPKSKKVKTKNTSFQILTVRLEDHESDCVGLGITGPDGAFLREDFLVLHQGTH